MVKKSNALDKILFIPFFDALRSGDFSELNVTEEEFDDLSADYFDIINLTESALDKQMQTVGTDIAIGSSCLAILGGKGYDVDLIDLIRDQYKQELYPDNVSEICEIIKNDVLALVEKFNTLKSQKPTVKAEKKTTGYDILADLILGTQISLKFNEVTVMEYISLSQSLKRKNTALKQSQKGSRHGSN